MCLVVAIWYLQRSASMGWLPPDRHGVCILHPVGPGPAAAGAAERHGGGRRLPRHRAAVVPHLAGPHHPAVPGGLHAGLHRLLARRHAHTDYLLEGTGTTAAGENNNSVCIIISIVA